MEKTKSKGNFKGNFKKHWKLSLILSVLIVLLAGVGMFMFLGNRNSQEALTEPYTIKVMDSKGVAVEEVYVVLCAKDGTELSWLPYVTNLNGEVRFSKNIEEGSYIKIVSVPLGYKAEENMQYTFDDNGDLTIVLADDDAVYEAQIGDTKYFSLITALGVANGANEEITIDLLSDTTMKSFKCTNIYDAKIILNGNGHTLTLEGDNNAFVVNQKNGELAFENINFIHKNVGAIVQVNSLTTISLTDVNIDATQGTAYNYALFNTLAVDGTTTLNMTRVNVKMAVGSAGKDNYGGVIRTGNTGGTKNVNINLESCNFDTTGATGRHGIIVMKNTIASLNIKNSTIKAADAYAVYAVEQTKAQTMTTVNSKYTSTSYPNSAVNGYYAQIGNTYYLPLEAATEIASNSNSDITLRFISDFTMKTATIHNKKGKLVTIDGAGKTVTTNGGTNAFVVGGKVTFKNMTINHKNAGSAIHMIELANVTMADVNLNATEGKTYAYCLINMLAAGGKSTLDCTRVNATMSVESKGNDDNAAIIRTGNASDADKKTIEINLKDCNFDTTKATGRSAIVVMKTTTATVNITNSKLVTMDDFVIRSNEQDINWNNADTTLDSLSPTYHDYPVEWYLAKIDDVFYTMKEALEVANAATIDTTIKLMADYTIKSYDVNNDIGKVITIDGNGKTITSNSGNHAFVVGNNVAMKNMKIVHKNGGSVVQITEAGNVSLQDITIDATKGSAYNFAIINIMAADHVTNLNLNNVDVTMSVAGPGANGKEGQQTAILRTGNEGELDAKTVNIDLKDCNWDAVKATGRSGIVVMKNTTANINIANSTIKTLDEAPIRAREDSTLAYTLTMTNTTLDSETKTFKNEPVRGYDAKIGDVYYHDLNNALEVAKASESDITVTLAQDITVKENIDITNEHGKVVTVNGNGYSVTGKGGNNTFRIQKPENGTVGKVELKNMKIVHKNAGAVVQVNAVTTVDLIDLEIDATQPDSTYYYALINIVAADKNATSYLTLTNVDLDMEDAQSKPSNKQAIVRTGNAGAEHEKNVEIKIVNSKLDVSDAADRNAVRVMDTTHAKVTVENSTLMTNNISAVHTDNTRDGQVTVIGNDFVCGKKVDDLSGFVLQLNDTWYVGDTLYDALNNVTENTTITLTADLSLDLNRVNNKNGKIITFIANGYKLDVTGSSNSVIIPNDTEVISSSQTKHLTVEEAVVEANNATEDITIKFNIDYELDLTNLNNVNGKIITIDPNGNTITGKGTLWDTVTVLGCKAAYRVGSTTYFVSDFTEALAQANKATGTATVVLYDDVTMQTCSITNNIKIDGNSHTITTTGGHNAITIDAAITAEFKNLKIVHKNTGSAVHVNVAGADVTLSKVTIDATAPDSEYYWAIINLVADGKDATTKLKLDEVSVEMAAIANATQNKAVIRTGNGNNKVDITINDSTLDTSRASGRNGLVILGTTEANVALTDTTIKTLDVAPIKDDSACASIRKINYLIDVTSPDWDNAVAYIGNTPYNSFASAITAANSSTTNARIELLADVEVATAVSINNTNGKGITIDGNLHEITTNVTHAMKIDYAGVVNFCNMDIKHIQQQTFVQVNQIAKVNLTDINVTAEEAQTDPQKFKYAIINTPAKNNTAENPIELNLTRVNLTMKTNDYGNAKTHSVLRTGNDNETRFINITLSDCNWNLTGAPHRIGINVMNQTTATVELINTTIQTNNADVVNDFSGKATITTRNDHEQTPVTTSQGDGKEGTKQLILDVPAKIYDAFIKWIKQFAEANEWNLNL